MIEKEQELEKNECLDIVEEVSLIYPQMHLNSPLFTIDTDRYVDGMNAYEKRFANLVQSKGLFVFREPVIEGIYHIPDFFIYNRNCFRGKLVELTLYDRECSNYNANRRSKERKKRQIAELESCGIPFVAIYRENMELIRRNCDYKLF